MNVGYPLKHPASADILSYVWAYGLKHKHCCAERLSKKVRKQPPLTAVFVAENKRLMPLEDNFIQGSEYFIMEAYSIFKDLAIIIVFAKIFGILARKCKAPQVVGEIIAGLLIGPSILGLVRSEEHTSELQSQS